MKLAALFILAFVVCAQAIGANQKEQQLARADAVEVWDQRTSDLHAVPTKIVDPGGVSAVVGAIQESSAKWKRGSFTSPSGYLRFVFKRGSDVIAVIGLGEGFLVRGGGGDWESKKISKKIEAKLASFAQKKKPNQSPEPTRGTGP